MRTAGRSLLPVPRPGDPAVIGDVGVGKSIDGPPLRGIHEIADLGGNVTHVASLATPRTA